MRRGRLAVLTLALVVGSAARTAEAYEIDTVHSSVVFKIRHIVSNAVGRFNEFGGTIEVNRRDLTQSSVVFTIRSASIDTGHAKRDEHLRSAEFFDVARHPEIVFRSTKISKSAQETYRVTGDFTLHGVTREITIPVQVLGFTNNSRFGDRAGFSTAFKINRKEYGIDWNAPLDTGGLLLGEDVSIEIHLEAIKPKDKLPPKGPKAKDPSRPDGPGAGARGG